MLKAIQARLHQGYKTNAFPERDPALPARYRGLPVLDGTRCDACGDCIARCPTGAITLRGPASVEATLLQKGSNGNPSAPGMVAGALTQNAVGSEERAHGATELSLDLGRCLFCGECEAACAQGAIRFSGSFRMGARAKEGLALRTSLKPPINASREGWSSPNARLGETEGTSESCFRTNVEGQLIEALDARMRAVFGRAMKIRQVSAGGCNACEADINVLETIGFDLSRFGISITASPRHADALIVTGPVSKNMELALKKTYDAMPEPKIVIAVGACAISGGIFAGSPEVRDGADTVIPVDLYLPGCPPHPMTILNGMLALLGRIQGRMKNLT